MAIEENKNEEVQESYHFIEEIVREDISDNKNEGRVHTRFPPEPNGYLHIGHAKAILLSYGLASKYGKFNLRFDDTNPDAEDTEYVDSIKEDLRWLGADWEDREFFASDYFEQLYEWATIFIKKGYAYVCAQTPEQVSVNRGTPTMPGKSPFRDRPIEESLDLFQRMRNGEFPDNSMTLRAKIDMASPNMHMRDPIMYRIKHVHHHRTGNKWFIYPTYDWTHGQSDFIEGITHSLCTLEFQVHRPLYDWFLDRLVEEGQYRPRQIEFARLNLNYTVMSKRKLLKLVKENYVNGWDDPRMPTISGLRRRGFTPESLKVFADKIGIAKRGNVIDYSLLEFAVRDDLNKKTMRIMGVLDPLKVVITNYPDGETEMLEAINNPEDESMGKRKVPFSKELFIERNDFMENPPRKFFRLGLGREVRLRYAYFITCNDVIKDENGEIIEIHCTYDPLSKGGKSPDGRKVKGTMHWVSAKDAVEAEVRLYDRLFVKENPEENDDDFIDNLNPDSLIVTKGYIEPYIKTAKVLDRFQFERVGYFCVDKDTTPEKIVFNRTVTLRDSWAKFNK